MSIGFLAKRFAQVFAIGFAILTFTYIVRGQPATQAARDAALWSLIAAAIFVGSAIYYRKTKKDCALCVENPRESARDERS
jgi:hypothetical protein